MNNPISALFGPSPIRPIQKHMAKAQNCITLLGDFLEATYSKEWQKAEEIQETICKTENEADTLKREIRTHLPRSLWLPVARNDLLEMLQIQDRLANRVSPAHVDSIARWLRHCVGTCYLGIPGYRNN